MKKIVAYVNTLRVHWLVEELGKMGIREMLVMEYFRPLSRISRFEFLCEASLVENVRRTVHRIGTTGDPGDHYIEVQDVEPERVNPLIFEKMIPMIGRGD